MIIILSSLPNNVALIFCKYVVSAFKLSNDLWRKAYKQTTLQKFLWWWIWV